MQGKTALVGAYIQRLAARVLLGDAVVLALVQKRSGLLPAERVIMKLYAVHGKDGRVPAAMSQAGFPGRQLLQLADALVRSLHNVLRPGQLLHGGDNGLLPLRPVPCLGEHLKSVDVVVAVHDQPGQAVGFAEDEAAGVRFAHRLPAIRPGFRHALPQQLEQLVFRVEQLPSQQPQPDLRG